MKITFFSCYLTHHQTPLCDELYRLAKGNFTFVSTAPIVKERLNMGYEDLDQKYSYVLREYENDNAKNEALRIALDSDIMIFGAAPEKYLKARLKQRKLTFVYSERLYKNKIEWYQYPRVFVSALRHHGVYQQYRPYMLCASAYTAGDCGKFGNYINRTYKWGYFPEVKKQDIGLLIKQKQQNDVPHILWAGRMIDWKHPEAAIHLAAELKKNGYKFKLSMVGNGAMQPDIQQMIQKQGLDDCVDMLGAMPPDQVRAHMEQADIFIATSDFYEGWGAVLNEAMNSGCALVVSHAMGSAGFLIQNGENGMIYQNQEQSELNECVEKLLDDSQLRERFGRNAYETLAQAWNAPNAAKRLLELANYLNTNKKGSPFESGPCSIATRIYNSNSWSVLK